MTPEACAAILRDHDPDRFGAVMAAAPADRAKLATLYALNLELARAPLQSAEPMLAEMRLQWWIDGLDAMGAGKAPPAHELLTPLFAAWGPGCAAMVPLAEARRRDCDRMPFAEADAVVAYIDTTGGALMWLAASALGAPETACHVIAQQARGVGLAGWLRALPQLQALGLGMAIANDTAMPRALAQVARAALANAARSHPSVPRRAAPALALTAGTPGFLASVANGSLNPLRAVQPVSDFRRRAAFARLAMFGRWWV